MGRVLLLITGIVVAVALMGALQPQRAGQTEKGASRPTVGQSSTTVAPAATKAVEPAEPTEYVRPCNPGQDRRGSDLCAQWKAADGTVESAVWAKWQTILSGLGLIGLFYSLHLTRKAVGEAKDATAVADAALKAQEEHAKRQLRAYVAVEAETLNSLQVGQRPAYLIIVRNSGQTPARNVRLYVRHKITSRGSELGLEIEPYDVPAFVIGAASEVIRQREKKLPLTLEQLRLITTGKCVQICKGVVLYEDVFGDEQMTRFSVQFEGAAQKLAIHGSWNEAT